MSVSNKDLDDIALQPDGPLVQAFNNKTDITQEGNNSFPTATQLNTTGLGQPSLKHLFHVNDEPLGNVLIFVSKACI